MPVIVVKNISQQSISPGVPLGILRPGKTLVRSINVRELEALSDSLNKLQEKQLIHWTVRQNPEDVGDTADFAIAAYSATKTFARMDIWVDAVRGSDTNDGHSPNEPLATLIEAESRIPDFVAHPVVVHVAPHAGAGYAPPHFRPRVLRSTIDIVADSGGTNNDGLNVLFGPSTAQTGTLHTKCVAPAGLGVDTYRGKTIEVLSGLAATYRRTIKTNTDTDIIPACLWEGSTIAPGDSFRIVEPVTQINLDQTPHLNYWEIEGSRGDDVTYGFNGDSRTRPGIQFVNFKFVHSGATKHIHCGRNTRIFGCEFAAPVILTGGSVAVAIDQISGPPQNQIYEELANVGTRLAGVHPKAWVGWGLSAQGLTISLTNSVWFYALVASSMSIFDSDVEFRGGNIHTGGITVFGTLKSSVARIDGKQYLPDLQLYVHNETGDAIRALGVGARVYLVEAYVTSTTGTGVRLEKGAHAQLFQGVSITAVTGVKATEGSSVQVRSAVGISASGNQLEIGPVPTVAALVDIPNNGDAIVASDNSIIQRTT